MEWIFFPYNPPFTPQKGFLTVVQNVLKYFVSN